MRTLPLVLMCRMLGYDAVAAAGRLALLLRAAIFGQRHRRAQDEGRGQDEPVDNLHGETIPLQSYSNVVIPNLDDKYPSHRALRPAR